MKKQDSLFSGILRVSSSNIIVLALGMLMSFIIPLSISVENYGYWQLFSLYGMYAGFFALGFNDGIFLNYAGLQYDDNFINKFSVLKKVPFILSVAGGILSMLVATILVNDGEYQFVIELFAVYVPAVCLNGFCAYTNQDTFRFKQYSRSIVIEKVICFLLVMVLVYLKIETYRAFIVSVVVSAYCKLAYSVVTLKEVFLHIGEKVYTLKNEIINNFTSGFVLMISGILGSSILVGSRLIIETYKGIEVFSGYSFAINTMALAIQCISAISQVLYPYMKKYEGDRLGIVIKKQSRLLTILGIFLMPTYYCVHGLIALLYQQYIGILSYLIVLYPLFIFQAKYTLLVNNLCMVKKDLKLLIYCNILGIAINCLITISAILVFNASITNTAIMVSFGYLLWYYISLVLVNKKHCIKLQMLDFIDVFVYILFVGANEVLNVRDVLDVSLLLPYLAISIVVALVICFIFRNKLKNTISFFRGL